jgi:hypothetical protein
LKNDQSEEEASEEDAAAQGERPFQAKEEMKPVHIVGAAVAVFLLCRYLASRV